MGIQVFLALLCRLALCCLDGFAQLRFLLGQLIDLALLLGKQRFEFQDVVTVLLGTSSAFAASGGHVQQLLVMDASKNAGSYSLLVAGANWLLSRLNLNECDPISQDLYPEQQNNIDCERSTMVYNPR